MKIAVEVSSENCLSQQALPYTISKSMPRNIGREFNAIYGNEETITVECENQHLGIVLVRGLFGAWLPRHFATPLCALRTAGWAAWIAPSSGTGNFTVNAALLADFLTQGSLAQRSLILLCHSKGGLDALTMLASHPKIGGRIAALVFCQTPRGGCPLLEDCFYSDPAQIKDQCLGAMLTVVRARSACVELTGSVMQACLPQLESALPSAPLLSLASWSSTPRFGIESQHSRMAKHAPNKLHDGLFFVEDQLWHQGEQILLSEVDHSQPALGGHGFRHDWLWTTLARLAARRAGWVAA